MILAVLVLAFFEGIGVLMFFNSDIALLLWPLENCFISWSCGTVQLNQLKNGTEKIAGGEPGLSDQYSGMPILYLREQGEQINHISDGMTHAIEERMKSERFKTELITNVSHDIKTHRHRSSICVDLLEKEELQRDSAGVFRG